MKKNKRRKNARGHVSSGDHIMKENIHIQDNLEQFMHLFDVLRDRIKREADVNQD